MLATRRNSLPLLSLLIVALWATAAAASMNNLKTDPLEKLMNDQCFVAEQSKQSLPKDNNIRVSCALTYSDCAPPCFGTEDDCLFIKNVFCCDTCGGNVFDHHFDCMLFWVGYDCELKCIDKPTGLETPCYKVLLPWEITRPDLESTLIPETSTAEESTSLPASESSSSITSPSSEPPSTDPASSTPPSSDSTRVFSQDTSLASSDTAAGEEIVSSLAVYLWISFILIASLFVLLLVLCTIWPLWRRHIADKDDSEIMTEAGEQSRTVYHLPTWPGVERLQFDEGEIRHEDALHDWLGQNFLRSSSGLEEGPPSDEFDERWRMGASTRLNTTPLDRTTTPLDRNPLDRNPLDRSPLDRSTAFDRSVTTNAQSVFARYRTAELTEGPAPGNPHILIEMPVQQVTELADSPVLSDASTRSSRTKTLPASICAQEPAPNRRSRTTVLQLARAYSAQASMEEAAGGNGYEFPVFLSNPPPPVAMPEPYTRNVHPRRVGSSLAALRE